MCNAQVPVLHLSLLSELLVSSPASDVARSVSSPHADISNTAGRPVYSGIFKGLLYICYIHMYICMYMPGMYVAILCWH